MLPIIQSLWVGADLSQLEKLCVQSFIDHGHTLHLYTYGNVGRIPAGASVKDANEILPASEIFRDSMGGLAGFSDYFRWALLNRQGNFWVDMDVVCLKPLMFDAAQVVFGRQADGEYCNQVVGLPKGHILAKTMLEVSINHTKIYPWDSHHDKTQKWKRRLLRSGREGIAFGDLSGPWVFTKVVKHLQLQHLAKPFMFCNPMPFQYWSNAFNRSFADGIDLFDNTYAIHLYNDMIRRAGMDKNACFDEDSLFEQLKTKHRIAPIPGAPRIRSADLAMLTEKINLSLINRNRRRKIIYIVAAVALLIIGLVIGFVIGKLQ